jgi:hypothetical protein
MLDIPVQASCSLANQYHDNDMILSLALTYAWTVPTSRSPLINVLCFIGREIKLSDSSF